MERFIKYFSILLLAISSITIAGCQTKSFDVKGYEPPALNEVKPIEKYQLDLSKIKKPDAPNFEFAVIDSLGNITFVDPNKSEFSPTHIVLKADEFKKIEALLDLTGTYKNLLSEQEALINTHVELVNSYISRLQMERELTRQYYFLWKNADDALEKERKSHTWDNIINKTTTVFTVIGGIVIAAL